MNIGIIGTGHMGGTLGGLWAKAGHKVFFGSRDTRKVAGLVRAIGQEVGAGSYTEAAQFGEVVLLATPWWATQEALKNSGSLENKILIDCTNPYKQDFSGFDENLKGSGAETVALWAPGAKVVKAFNALSFAVIKNPDFNKLNATLFYCGDDLEAKSVVAGLGKKIGLDPVDCGPLRIAGMLEGLAGLWVHLAYNHGMTETAFKLLRR